MLVVVADADKDAEDLLCEATYKALHAVVSLLFSVLSNTVLHQFCDAE